MNPKQPANVSTMPAKTSWPVLNPHPPQSICHPTIANCAPSKPSPSALSVLMVLSCRITMYIWFQYNIPKFSAQSKYINEYEFVGWRPVLSVVEGSPHQRLLNNLFLTRINTNLHRFTQFVGWGLPHRKASWDGSSASSSVFLLSNLI